MEVINQFPVQVERWGHAPIEQFLGHIFDNGYRLRFGITPEDLNEPECCYFNVWVEKEMKNMTTDKVVFYAKTYHCFKVRNNYEKPTAAFFFELISEATFQFALRFRERTQNTNLMHHQIAKPTFSQVKEDVEKTIDIWDKTARNSVFLTPPNWQARFRDLPEIPEHKKWIKGSYSTVEQNICQKLFNREPITKAEEDIFVALTGFYADLDGKLKELDYQSFTPEDFENFKNYIFYGFNYLPLITNDLTIFSTYRLVVNEHVTKKNESITDIAYLKYPTLEKVKEINKFNRANSPNTNIFYSAGSIDTAIKETRPPLNKLVTVGIWEPKDVNKKFISFPVSHSEEAMQVNRSARDATNAFEEMGKHNSALLMNYMRQYFRILGYEYSKKVDYNKENYHYEYLISALFSERILSKHQEINDAGDFKYDCIIYPSVGHDYLTENIAMLPDTLDRDFYLAEVWEFEVDEPRYDLKTIHVDPEAISLATTKNFRKAKKVHEDGRIEW